MTAQHIGDTLRRIAEQSAKKKQEQGSTTTKNKKDKEEKPLQYSLPLPDENTVVFSEVNIERWSNFIFPHYKAKNLDQKRTIRRSITLQDGTTGEQSITVQPGAGDKSYTNKTHRVFLALVLLWDEKGKSLDGTVTFSLREIAKKLNLKWSGSNIASRLLRELDCLNGTRMAWAISFEVDKGQRESVRKFHIISDISYESFKERIQLRRFEALCTIRFNEKITHNLLTKKISPVNLTTLLSFKNGISEVFYCRIDSVMSQVSIREWSGIRILKELQLSDIKIYSRPARRKYLLEKICADINGKPLSSGEILHAQLGKTADGKDHKITCTKTPAPFNPPIKKNFPEVKKQKGEIENLVEEIARRVGEKEKNYGWYFLLAKHYSSTVIFRALGEFEETYRDDVKSPGAWFTDRFHQIVHLMDLEWIGTECDKTCPYRKENQITL